MKALTFIGRILLGISYAIYGYMHFTHADADQSMVPHFVGYPLFWVYFIGACWVAVALSFLANVMTRLSGVLASVVLMSILFFVQLPHFSGMMSFLSVASTIALVGGSLIVAGEGKQCICKKEEEIK